MEARNMWFSLSGGLLGALMVTGYNYHKTSVQLSASQLDFLSCKQASVDKQASASELQQCLDIAENRFQSTWDNDCLASSYHSVGCALVPATQQEMGVQLRADKEDCLKQYPQN